MGAIDPLQTKTRVTLPALEAVPHEIDMESDTGHERSPANETVAHECDIDVLSFRLKDLDLA